MDKSLDLIEIYKKTRQESQDLCNNLLIEDYVIQSMEDVSPPKWHLAHTTWFFESFILNQYTDYKSQHANYHYIFNSYYQGLGIPYPRKQRGFLARPSVQEVYEYRQEVDTRLLDLISTCSRELFAEIQTLVILGINHEQQHQELLLMDIKHNLSFDPNFPAYKKHTQKKEFPSWKMQFIELEGGLMNIGYAGSGFCYDNELPRHQSFIVPFSIANRLVTNQEYLEFIEDKGYSDPRLWLADAWDWLQLHAIQAPLYWLLQDKQWKQFSLEGLSAIQANEPVMHISFYEADAYARWKNARLATEEEWEYAADFFENTQPSLWSGLGELWEWTSSAYLPYPASKPLQGVLGEYNAKFMNNQRVLRGASFATPLSHRRLSYRNYYAADKRWQFSGIRLARNN